MTLVSVVVVLTIKSYTLEAQDKVVNDVDVERMASCKLINHADTLRHEKMINRFVFDLEKSDALYEKYSGSADFPNETYSDFERLKRVATQQELNNLLVHESGIVRVYAHRALMDNNMYVNKYQLEMLASDTSSIAVIDGLSYSKIEVKDLVSKRLFN
jgi:hypothetical protein